MPDGEEASLKARSAPVVPHYEADVDLVAAQQDRSAAGREPEARIVDSECIHAAAAEVIIGQRSADLVGVDAEPGRVGAGVGLDLRVPRASHHAAAAQCYCGS